MIRRCMLSVVLLAAFLPAAPADAQSRRAPSARQGVLGIAAADPKSTDRRNGRKRAIYDADGRRDYRRDFDETRFKGRQQTLFCQQYPGDEDCFGRRF